MVDPALGQDPLSGLYHLPHRYQDFAQLVPRDRAKLVRPYVDALVVWPGKIPRCLAYWMENGGDGLARACVALLATDYAKLDELSALLVAGYWADA